MAIIALSSVFCNLICDEAEVLASLAWLVSDRSVGSSILAADAIATRMVRAPHIVARCSIMAEI